MHGNYSNRWTAASLHHCHFGSKLSTYRSSIAYLQGTSILRNRFACDYLDYVPFWARVFSEEDSYGKLEARCKCDS